MKDNDILLCVLEEKLRIAKEALQEIDHPLSKSALLNIQRIDEERES